MQSDWEKFLTQRNNAKKRNIEWQLTFDEWITWWLNTGHYHERGRGKGKYLMSRYGDTGPYSLDNIFCNLHSQNIIEANTKKTKSPAHADKLRTNLDTIRKKRKVITPDGIFESGYACGRYYKVTGEAVAWRCKQTDGQFKDWRYEDN